MCPASYTDFNRLLTIKNIAFSDVTPYSLVDVYQVISPFFVFLLVHLGPVPPFIIHPHQYLHWRPTVLFCRWRQHVPPKHLQDYTASYPR
jgi:hypothetical protein